MTDNQDDYDDYQDYSDDLPIEAKCFYLTDAVRWNALTACGWCNKALLPRSSKIFATIERNRYQPSGRELCWVCGVQYRDQVQDREFSRWEQQACAVAGMTEE